MTHEHALSKQTKDELIKLFTRTLNIEGAAPITIKLNDGEAEELLRALDYVIGYSYSSRACCMALVWIFSRVAGAQEVGVLMYRLHCDDYRKFITNQAEAKQVSRAALAMLCTLGAEF